MTAKAYSTAGQATSALQAMDLHESSPNPTLMQNASSLLVAAQLKSGKCYKLQGRKKQLPQLLQTDTIAGLQNKVGVSTSYSHWIRT